MSTCTVRWRPSGGRGEYEAVPAATLGDREIYICIPSLGVNIPAEVRVKTKAGQGKPRVRKNSSNDRSKLHLIPLVMAVARLPDPGREDKHQGVSWPLEEKNFVVSDMDFEVLERDDDKVVLEPKVARILHSDKIIDFSARFLNIAIDAANIAQLQAGQPELAEAVSRHFGKIKLGKNSNLIRESASEVIALQAAIFGISNIAALSTIIELPETPLEEGVTGKEGKILVRLHSYRERDRKFVKEAKANFKKLHGKLFCECCGYEPVKMYGERGEDRIDAHHRTPVEELLPDSITKIEDLAMVCPNCHDIIHAKRPWLTVESLKDILEKNRSFRVAA
jgi:hypothetical protein